MKKALKLSCYFVLCINTVAYAEIITDGTMGNVAAQTTLAPTTIDGKNFLITQDLGTKMGGNLFHSFKTFNIDTGGSATFNSTDSFQNVITRVTGGSPSTINGLLKSNISNANFYFINPAGVIFGKSAQINVPADFHVSTANALQFKDGKQFTASVDLNASQLTISDPSSFGFLANSIDNIGKITVDGANLSLTDGKTLDIVANNIIIQNTAQLSASAGKIRLLAFKGAGSVSPELDDQNNDTLPLEGNGGNIFLDNSDLVSDGTNNGGGHIALWGGNIDIKNYSAVKAITRGGFAGSVIVKSDNLDIHNGAAIRTTTVASGSAGNIFITSNNLNIDGQLNTRSRFTGITSGAESGTGSGGTITVNVSNLLNIENFAGIRSNTFLTGNAGTVTVSAKALNIDGHGLLDSRGVPRFTGIASRAETASSGEAGKVSVTADKLDIINLGQISSSTFATNNAGQVEVFANTIVLDGKNNFNNNLQPTGISAQANTDPAIKNSATLFKGKAGSVSVTALKSLTVTNAAQITSNSATAGDAGTVTVTAPLISLNNNSSITTSATTGNGGDIAINADQLINLKNSGIITSVYKSSGKGGDINVSAHSLIMNNAVIQANADGGSGGDINIKLQALIPSQNQLITGGKKVDWLPYQEGLNVIQAASQRGVSGSINVTSPKFNISGSLTGLDSNIELPILTNNPCQSSAAFASSLARSGKGGLPATEAITVFIPAISQTISNHLQSNVSLSEKISTDSSAYALSKTYPCTTVATEVTGIK